MASPSCSSAPGSFKYDVFLSFRGEDTRTTFTSHLRKALDRNQINTYMDNEIERGEEIAPALLQAIEESKLSVVILSQNYASSTWCLDELAHILEFKERHQQLVIPIFYGVDPSHVRNQWKSYAAAFVQHEKHFKDTPDKVLKWREALTKASNLAGFDSRNTSPDSKLVEEVLKDIQKKLNRKYSRDLTPQDVEHRADDCPSAGDDDSPSAGDDEGDDEDSPSASDEDSPSASDEDSSSAGDEDSPSADICFNCGGIGHWVEDCPSADICFNCGVIGHWAEDCLSASDEDSLSADKCFNCGGIGHWVEDCPSADICFNCGGIGHWAEDCPSADKCFNCGGIGHWAEDYPSASDEDSPSADKCFNCGGIGHWAEDCPSDNLDKCSNCGGIGHWAEDCPSDSR